MGAERQAKQGERALHVIDGSIPVLSVFESGGTVVVDVTRKPREGEQVLVERAGRKVMGLYPARARSWARSPRIRRRRPHTREEACASCGSSSRERTSAPHARGGLVSSIALTPPLSVV